MEEAGPQVASPIFIHQQTLPGPFSLAKKRDLPNIQAPQRMMTQTPGLQNPVMDNWNPNVWGWDSLRFVAKPVDLRLGTPRTTTPTTTTTAAEKNKPLEEEDESLMLNLGGSFKFVEEDSEPPSRSNKRVRSGSPGTGGNYPMCQVDNCKEDLSNAKDYHRRHKVCELHSKSTQALVANQMQRFCQQCSRFHPLSEFDEGKRSCRRRLAGHNRRRRKTQPEDVGSRLLLPGNRDNNANAANLDIVNLLAAIARAQGKNEDKTMNCSSVPDRDHLVQILSKIHSLSLPADLAAKLPNLASLNGKVQGHASLEQPIKLNGNTSSPSTMDLLTVLSSTPATPTPDATPVLSQKSSQSSDSEKTKITYVDQATPPNLSKRPPLEFNSVGGDRSSSSSQSPMEDSDGQVQDARVNLPLQLFGSSPEDDSATKLASSRNYFSSDSSNPVEERSPSSSPVQNLFPMLTKAETMKHKKMTIGRGLNTNNVASRTADCNRPFDLFRGSNTGAEPGSFQSFPYQGGYASSGSDHSPSSLNSDAQDRTGRIIFKLFDKDPGHFPVTLRTEIYHWLSNRPSEMESFIRPGCVVLSIYVSMSSAAWEQLEQNLLERVNALVESSDSDFWRSGRFIVHTGRQLASHKDGKIRLCKSWRTWSSPELILVSPLAVVGGQETPLLLKGRNLSNPGAKIHCTYMGGYISKEITESTRQRTSCDEINLVGFKIQSEAPGVVGRCFIEVENGFKGSYFPVIIADSIICEELRLLESEFDLEPKEYNVVMGNKYDFGRPKSREEVLLFLNELGWLFQRKGNTSMLGGPDYSLSRLRFLLTFSVERDCCALVRAILDILVESNLDGDELSRESLETLSEIQLLNRAVKRRCRKMVNMLINYFIISCKDASRKYIFLPNVVGPGGITPLHLAACTSGSDDLIDALTSDPQEIGLNCWTSLLDASGQSPYAYAMTRSNHSYNKLVARKLTDRKNGQVSVTVSSEIEQSQLALEQEHRIITQFKQRPRSCVSCAAVARKYNMRVPASQGLLQRPFIHSMLGIAAVCVCVCLFLRGSPDIGSVAPFKWENLDFGTM